MATRNNQQDQTGNSIPPEVIKSFFDLQKDEIQVRKQELDLSTQQETNQKAIAEASIKAQLTDRDSQRSHVERKTKLQFIGGTVLLSVILAFLGFALHLGKEAVVLKALEISGIFIAGFVGGYGFKSSKHPAQKDTAK